MKKLSNITIGFFQAIGVVLYCSLVVLIMNNLSQIIPYNDEIIAGLFILILFIISAIITSSLVLAYPIYLYLEKRQTRKAIILVIITTLWLVGFFLGLLGITSYFH